MARKVNTTKKSDLAPIGVESLFSLCGGAV